jgi:hypothetical protein
LIDTFEGREIEKEASYSVEDNLAMEALRQLEELNLDE